MAKAVYAAAVCAVVVAALCGAALGGQKAARDVRGFNSVNITSYTMTGACSGAPASSVQIICNGACSAYTVHAGPINQKLYTICSATDDGTQTTMSGNLYTDAACANMASPIKLPVADVACNKGCIGSGMASVLINCFNS